MISKIDNGDGTVTVMGERIEISIINYFIYYLWIGSRERDGGGSKTDVTASDW